MCYSFFYLMGDRSIKKNNCNELCLFTVIGAGDGNRTHVVSLEGWSSTIELHPQHQRWCPGPESNRHGV